MITDPLFYALAVPAVILIGLSKGGFGGTAALVGVPLMAMAVDPVTAAGVLLPILVVMDVIGLAAWRGRFDRGVVSVFAASIAQAAPSEKRHASVIGEFEPDRQQQPVDDPVEHPRLDPLDQPDAGERRHRRERQQHCRGSEIFVGELPE